MHKFKDAYCYLLNSNLVVPYSVNPFSPTISDHSVTHAILPPSSKCYDIKMRAGWDIADRYAICGQFADRRLRNEGCGQQTESVVCGCGINYCKQESG